MASICVNAVTKRFGRHVALQEVSVEINDEEFVVLLGPSGCGKTTLLNVIAGLERPDAGTVSIDGECADRLSPGERDLGFVFQSYALYPTKTVRENLEFALRFRRSASVDGETRAAFAERRVREVATLLRIDSLLGRLPAELSGGQRQRVAMGRALVRAPRAFLFDEPLSNLDALLRLSVRQEIRQLHDQLRTTMVYVTHDQVEAMSLGQRIVLMNDGRVVEVATPQQIYNSPQTLFAARFVGSPPMNFIPGTLEEEDGRLMFRSGPAALRLPELVAGSYRHYVGRPVIFGIRPDDIDIIDRFSASSKLHALLQSREFHGSMWLVHLTAAGNRVVIASADGGANWTEADVYFDMSKFHLFDDSTGRVIHARR